MNLIPTETFDLSTSDLMDEKVKEYILKSKSDNTKKAYRNAWKDFSEWCQMNGLTHLPACPKTVASYLIEKSKTLKISTLEQRLVAIRQAHEMAGFPFEKNNSIIRDTFKGVKNTHGCPQTRKSPIIIDDLRAMIECLEDTLQGKRDRALLILGFTGAFRRSELVALKFEDLNFKKEGIEILLRRSKTDQQGKGEVIPIPYGSNPSTCPVRSIKDWLEASGICEGYIFRSINKHGNISQNGLTDASVAFIIKRNLYIKENQMQFSGHSLRAGFCTQSALNNVPLHSAMKHARQKKVETHQKYIRLANLWKDCAATKLGL